eukprot:s1997_g11.t1
MQLRISGFVCRVLYQRDSHVLTFQELNTEHAAQDLMNPLAVLGFIAEGLGAIFGGLLVRRTVSNRLGVCWPFVCCLAGSWAFCPAWFVVPGSLDFCLGLFWTLPGPVLPIRLPGHVCWLHICMSSPSPSHDAGIELRITLPGDLQVVVTGPSSSAARAAELLGHISLFGGFASSRSDRSFEVVSSVAEPVPVSGARGRPETRDSIQQSFAPCPDRLLVHCSRLCGSSLSGKDRIHRAWLAGQWAAAAKIYLEAAGEPDVRPGGLLAVVPIGLVPEEVLAVGNSPSPRGAVGPSTVLVVPSQVLDNGMLAPSGGEVAVLVVDMAETVLTHMRLPDAFSQLTFSFDLDQPFAIPSPSDLQTKIQEWLEAGGDSAALGYVTADGEGIDGLPLSDGDLPPDPVLNGDPPSATPKVRKAAAKPAALGLGKPIAGHRRPTVASLAGSLQQLTRADLGTQTAATREALPSVRDQLHVTAEAFEPAYLYSLASADHAVHSSSKSNWHSPKDCCTIQPATVEISLDSTCGDYRVGGRANGADPMVELGASAFGAGTRLSQGRAKLQAELASQKGTFFQAVLSAMARRMQPTAPAVLPKSL